MKAQSKNIFLIRVVTLVIIILINNLVYSQDDRVLDSLERKLKSTKSVNIKAQVSLEIGYHLLTINPEKAREYAMSGIISGQNSNNKTLLPNLWRVVGGTFFYEGEWEKSLNAYKKSLQIALKNKTKKEVALAYSNIGLTYTHMGNFIKAQKNLLLSLGMRETLKDLKGEVSVLSNLGTLYNLMNNPVKSAFYHEQAYKKALKTGDKSRIAQTSSNLCTIYYDQKEYVKTLDYFNKAIALYKEIDDNWSLSIAYSNKGMILTELKRFDEAEIDLLEALKLNKNFGNQSGEALSYTRLASLFCEKGMFKKGIDFYLKAEKIFIINHEPDNLKDLYKSLSEEFIKNGKPTEAFNYLLKYDALRDTLLDESQARAVEEMATKYETTKKEKEIALQKQNLKIKSEMIKSKQSELESEKLFKNSVVVGLCLALILSIVIARSLILNKRKNKLITEQKRLVEEQKANIEEKSKEITDSINYARRIQQAILPPTEMLSSKVPDSFIYYQPKDVVSGDFYQLYQLKNELIIVTADCTGHGVPGAFMSMIGNEQLGKIIMEKELHQPAEILDSLHKGIRKALKQDRNEGETRDGMDVALYKLNYETLELEYAGANRPLWIIEDRVLREIKANKQAIGGLQNDSRTAFTNHKVKLKKGSVLYSFTDGYSDQFGGEKGKKYMLKKFERLLVGLMQKTMAEQSKLISEEFNSWKGNREQVDDVLIIGIRV